MGENSWFCKTLSVIADCNFAERKYLFEQSRILKQAMRERDEAALKQFRIDDADFGIYEVFLEDSTRTKESFRNAASFLRVRIADLISSTCSLNKFESFRDTFHTLIGYGNQIFIVRSRQEGLCRWLAKSSAEYCKRMAIRPLPAFINGGDGAHEHPTQELYDDFTFLEDLGWDYSCIHIALIGDLLHGRTVHSKVDGLQIFGRVRVDLIAPDEMGLPRHYRQSMSQHGYTVRSFASIDEYLAQGDLAPIWYFTRLQLERMDQSILRREAELRRSVTFSTEHLAILQKNSPKNGKSIRFYHPMPRHKKFPVIPTFLDNSEYNGWERQCANGLIVRISLLALIAGKRAPEPGLLPPVKAAAGAPVLYEKIALSRSGGPKVYSEGLRPIQNGIVIDHILRGYPPQDIRRHMQRIVKLMQLDHYRGGQWVGSSHGVCSRHAVGSSHGAATQRAPKNQDSNQGSEKIIYKGLIFLPDAKTFSPEQLRKLSAIAPHITINYIEQSKVHSKYRLLQPPRIYGFQEIGCLNRNCISHESHCEGADPEFWRDTETDSQRNLICIYCNTAHNFYELWHV